MRLLLSLLMDDIVVCTEFAAAGEESEKEDSKSSVGRCDVLGGVDVIEYPSSNVLPLMEE